VYISVQCVYLYNVYNVNVLCHVQAVKQLIKLVLFLLLLLVISMGECQRIKPLHTTGPVSDMRSSSLTFCTVFHVPRFTTVAETAWLATSFYLLLSSCMFQSVSLSHCLNFRLAAAARQKRQIHT